MWIVKLALNRPYTFIVLALLILILSPVVILRTPTDIFPNINIPVVSIGWTYTGLNPEELEGRLTTPYEKALTTLVDNIQHVESTTYNGYVVVKVFLQPGASLDTANAQVTAASQYLLRQLPPGILPPQIINFSASSVPILQLGVSGKDLSEQQLNDYAQNFVRPQLITVPGAVIPLPYGGKQRQITISMDQNAMQSKGIAPGDLLNAVEQQNVVMPSGTIKIGPTEYDVRTNGSPRTVEELAGLPLKQVNGTTIYLRDVATVSDGFQVQTNIVRQDGRRGVLISVLKNGNSSTLDVVKGIRSLLPRVKLTLPPALRIVALSDQSVFVRGAVSGVVREAIIAAALTALMILLFLGSWRSTIIIAVSIPLSILTSVIVLSLLGETINTMTLGGLALAVGILVDDATVTIENIERFLEEGQPLRQAILEGAAQISVPALVSTLVHLHRVPADVLPRRRGAVSVCAAGRGGGVRDAGVLRALANAGADAGDVPAASHTNTTSDPATCFSAFSTDSTAASSGCARAMPRCWTGWCYIAGFSFRSFCWHMSVRLPAGSVARAGFLSEYRQRAVHPACSRAKRHAD